MSILGSIWKWTFKKPYHFLMPRFRIRKKIFGLTYVINLNDHLSFLRYRSEENVRATMEEKWGRVWDVGCNFGLFSILSASKGNQVTAFDLSPLALDYLKQSAALNGVEVTIVDRPLTVQPKHFSRPKNADCTNAVPEEGDDSAGTSMTYPEAEQEFGTPALIKMDIEGGEQEFFGDTGFLKWLEKNRISLLVELHNGFRPPDGILNSATVKELDATHRLYSFKN